MIDIISPTPSSNWTQMDHHWLDENALAALWGIGQDDYFYCQEVAQSSPTKFQASPSELVTFSFTSFSPDLNNCVVMGPHQQPYMYITTDLRWPTYTIFQDVQGEIIALIEWQDHPLVEIRDVVSKCRVADWLSLAADRKWVHYLDLSGSILKILPSLPRSRIMFCGGSSYTWSPKNMCFDVRFQPFCNRCFKALNVIILALFQ